MLRDSIIEFLRANKQLLNSEYGVEQIGLFGSHARGEEKDSSDIDILISTHTPTFKAIFTIQKLLEKKFNKRVDVTRKGIHLRQSFLDTIEKEIIYA